MEICKHKTKHHRMSWVLLRLHSKSKYQRNSGCFFFGQVVLPKGYQMDDMTII